jgi:transcriptional regulator with XRE-family HTH domain
MNECPSLTDLTSPEPAPAVAAHVRECARCSALRRALSDTRSPTASREPVTTIVWPHAPTADLAAPPRPGAIHAIWGDEDGDLLVAVIVDVDEREALVLPVSPDVHFAGDSDVLIEDEAVAYPAMVEVWNHVQVLSEQIMEQVGVLRDSFAAELEAAVDAITDSEPLPATLRQGVPLLTEKDPRLLFRERESDRIRRFVDPWRALNDGDTLGEVVRGRREEKDLTLEALGAIADLTVEALSGMEADSQDLYADVPVAALGKLADGLGLVASRRLGDLVEAAVFTNDRTPEPSAETMHARRRRGVRSASVQPPEDVRLEHAREYAAKLLARMKGER